MKLYINSTGIISGAGSNNLPDFLLQQQEVKNGKLLCVEPDYTPFIPPMQLRRMSKAVRIGIASSKIAMEQAGITKPDALSIGTAMGCLQDTELFLTKMADQDEQMLTPTAFIQSTHNTVSGQIALLAGCYGHNLTFVQRGHSFEHALINAQLYLEEHAGEKMLVGGIDELTENSYNAFRIGGVYNETISAGEGASFFVVTDKAITDKALCIKDLHCFTADDNATAIEKIKSFLLCNKVEADVFLSGSNGEKDDIYSELVKSVFANAAELRFKHLCGEYPTASSFALGMLADAVKNSVFPETTIVNKKPTQWKNIVLVNHFKQYYSCWHITVD